VDRRQIDDEHIVARYLAGQLDETGTAQFEACYTHDPDIVRDLEHTLRLKEGLALLQERGELEALMRRRARWPRAAGLAAGIVALAAGMWLWTSHARVAPIAGTITALAHANGMPLRIASTHVLVRTRGSQPAVEIALPPDGGALELRIVPSYRPKNAAFHVMLGRLDAADTVVPLGGIHATASSDDGFVTAYLDAARLSRGRYLIEARPERGDERGAPADRFVIELR
jgi:hypothetical protein